MASQPQRYTQQQATDFTKAAMLVKSQSSDLQRPTTEAGRGHLLQIIKTIDFGTRYAANARECIAALLELEPADVPTSTLDRVLEIGRQVERQHREALGLQAKIEAVRRVPWSFCHMLRAADAEIGYVRDALSGASQRITTLLDAKTETKSG